MVGGQTKRSSLEASSDDLMTSKPLSIGEGSTNRLYRHVGWIDIGSCLELPFSAFRWAWEPFDKCSAGWQGAWDGLGLLASLASSRISEWGVGMASASRQSELGSSQKNT